MKAPKDKLEQVVTEASSRHVGPEESSDSQMPANVKKRDQENIIEKETMCNMITGQWKGFFVEYSIIQNILHL